MHTLEMHNIIPCTTQHIVKMRFELYHLLGEHYKLLAQHYEFIGAGAALGTGVRASGVGFVAPGASSGCRGGIGVGAASQRLVQRWRWRLMNPRWAWSRRALGAGFSETEVTPLSFSSFTSPSIFMRWHSPVNRCENSDV
jgi:hypothetical protein